MISTYKWISLSLKMKKILLIAHLPPPIHGVSVISQYILKSNIINSKYKLSKLNLSSSKSISQIGKKSISKYFFVFRITIKLFLILISKKIDLVYLTLSPKGAGFLKDSILVLILKLFNKKIIFHIHGKGINEYYQSLPRLFKFYYRLIFSNVSIILLSETLKNDLNFMKNTNNIYFVNNGINKKYLNEPALENKKNHPIKILFFSNFQKSKGVFDLLNAIPLLKKKYGQSVNYVLAGDTRDDIGKQMKILIQDNSIDDIIEFVGPKYDHEKEYLFENADIFIHPTLNDCFPLVLLEALKFGLPIVSTSEGAIPDIVTDRLNGLIIKKNSPLDISEKLSELIDSENLRYKISNANKAKFFENYTSKIMEKNLIDVFEKAIK